jgi:hypothetical protein
MLHMTSTICVLRFSHFSDSLGKMINLHSGGALNDRKGLRLFKCEEKNML